MDSPSDGVEPSAKGSGLFTTTHWSVVLSAGQQDSPLAAEALEKLCRTYWYPLYAYVRRCGHGPDDAQDLTQEFFARLLEKSSLARADRAKGRFRSFLLGALNHFLADEQDRAQAQKRGGGQTFISWDQDDAEERFGAEPADELSPDKLFDRRWALTVLEQAANRLRDEYQAAGRRQFFDLLKGYVAGEQVVPSYAVTAARLGLTESAVKSAVFRLRRRYHELVREGVAQTVAGPAELEDEIRYLVAIFSSPAVG
ncbi:MAG: RNA polymerase sigma factor [Verrucomicrobiia bacterium]